METRIYVVVDDTRIVVADGPDEYELHLPKGQYINAQLLPNDTCCMSAFTGLTQKQPEQTEPKEEKSMEPYRLSFYAVKPDYRRPAVFLFQHASNRLAELLGKDEWKVSVDGVAGKEYTRVSKEIQEHFGLTADAVFGKNSWRAVTPELGDDWRAPLYLRIAECQNTFESGRKGFGYKGMIPVEGWFNYGIWNVNRESARTLMKMGGASQTLIAKVNEADARDDWDVANEISEWFGSRDGRETQVGSYVLKKLIKPSIENLVLVGFDIKKFGVSDLDDLKKIDDFPVSLDPFYERLLMLSVDITVNSGASGFRPAKTPRRWNGHGDQDWPADRLPSKGAVKDVFSEVFGQEIPNDWTYISAPDGSREYYGKALKRSLWELCETNEQRIELIAELQSRCIVDRWRDMVMNRRRCVARKEGHPFQGSYYCMSEHFGIGI